MRSKFSGLAMATSLALGLSVSSANAALLYKITGKDMAEPSYLYGTIHLICEADFNVAEATQKAFDEADKLIMELDMDDPNMMQSMQAKIFQPEGLKISSGLSEAQAEKLDAFFKANMGVGLSAFDGMRPFVVSGMLMSAQLDCGQPASFEGYFTQQAMMQQKPVEGLETVDFQFGVFEQIPHAEQVQWLADALEDEAGAKAELQRMIDLYQAEDIDGMYGMFTEMDEYAEYKEVLLDQRNFAWQESLDKELQAEGSEFIAVGAGHLGGKAGMINLLRERGYTVEPVSN
ncbi:MAG: TraB/GumN family protein [Idiomarinaceae bacterium]|uniref:TraB/GumN family protein n=1 Tax=Pseudidiomarina aquimaris TaxID=641841 RepID=UPI000C3FE3A5|nr:TraB/GumN family protein [Idiomarinaceae bacterium]|tara:strand:- start:507 stop:1373 length:867 start_codon:yes stop_codon:yes gene_type:complete